MDFRSCSEVASEYPWRSAPLKRRSLLDVSSHTLAKPIAVMALIGEVSAATDHGQDAQAGYVANSGLDKVIRRPTDVFFRAQLVQPALPTGTNDSCSLA